MTKEKDIDAELKDHIDSEKSLEIGMGNLKLGYSKKNQSYLSSP
jgi:hypothetical protein